MSRQIVVLIGALLAVSCVFSQSLPKLNINPNTVTVSGISAGAAMAVQFEIAYSSLVKAGGIIAGLPYQASGGSLAGAMEAMDDPEFTINVASLVAQASIDASLGLIDPVAGVANHTVYLFGGLFDTVVNHQAMVDVQSMYQEMGVTKMVAYFNYTAEHAWITNYYGNACDSLGSPYINNCGLDFAGNYLAAAFTDMGIKWNTTRGTLDTSNVAEFQQTLYGADVLLNSLAGHGYMYVPKQCASGKTECHLHMTFHGCTQEASSVGLQFILFSGINEWAESNNIVVLYPQAGANILADNPNACFDWWGYAGSNYAQKAGAQQTIFRAFIKAIGGF